MPKISKPNESKLQELGISWLSKDCSRFKVEVGDKQAKVVLKEGFSGPEYSVLGIKVYRNRYAGLENGENVRIVETAIKYVARISGIRSYSTKMLISKL